MLLEKIERSSDIKNLREEDYPLLAQEIRQFLLEKISHTGGHLASNLGVVELTMALHLAFNLPTDYLGRGAPGLYPQAFKRQAGWL